MPVRIGLLGDIMLGRAVGERFLGAGSIPVWAPELLEITAALDLVVCNLECCLSDRGAPTGLIGGKPFFFRGPPRAVQALEALGAGVVGVANNHLLDFGEQAAVDTVALLASHGMAAAGAGAGPAAARDAAIVTRRGARIGVLAASDHPAQFAAAASRFGIAYAPLREGPPRWLVDGLAALRERCDLTIAFLHWGPNMTSGPAPWQRGAARQLRAAGADLIAGHSAHAFHGVGWLDARPVLFDLGDALDDYTTDPVLRNDLGVLAIWSPNSAEGELELVGLKLEFCHTRLARGADADWIDARLERACRRLGTRAQRVEEQRFVVRSRRG
jgi:poly-gamma-glutamate synthesis protein (capsule biosynthesis protein)